MQEAKTLANLSNTLAKTDHMEENVVFQACEVAVSQNVDLEIAVINPQEPYPSVLQTSSG